MTIKTLSTFAELSGKGKRLHCSAVTCHYCSTETHPVYAKLVTGRVIYPQRAGLDHLKFWQCACGAYVGTHKKAANGDGTVPLGRLADAELRAAKVRAHGAFDALWQRGTMRRKEAYAWLADKLGLTKDQCHIGLFDVLTCQRAEQLASRFWSRAGDDTVVAADGLTELTLDEASERYAAGYLVGLTACNLPPTRHGEGPQNTRWISNAGQSPQRTFARRARAISLHACNAVTGLELRYHADN